MFSEILKIIPKVEGKDLNGMERSLNTRFSKVAKKFGSGLVSMLKGGAVVGAVTFLIDKILNPLGAVKDSINKALGTADDLKDFSVQFGTTSGKLAMLQALAGSKGLDPEGLRMLLVKFQLAVAKAAANPGESSSVINYVGKTDTAEAFFEFIQALHKLDDTQQTLVQAEVFGGRLISKSSDFLKSAGEFKGLSKVINGLSGNVGTENLTAKIDATAEKKQGIDTYAAALGIRDLYTKGGLIKDTTINSLNAQALRTQNRENENLGNFKNLKHVDENIEKMSIMLERIYNWLSGPAAESMDAVGRDIEGAKKDILNLRNFRFPKAGD